MSTSPEPGSYRPAAWTTEHSHVQIEHTWSNDTHAGVSGFVLVKSGRPQDLRILCEGNPPGHFEWLDRPDVYAFFPDYLRFDRCGFRAWFPRRASHLLDLTLPVDSTVLETKLRLDGTGYPEVPPESFEVKEDDNAWFNRVNRDCRSVLEIGSRVVSPDSASKRAKFAPGVTYTGFDYYPDSNTDVVGDAHQLSSYFQPDQKFDAIFSLAVFEHLAMPWVVPVEINRLLPIGGLTYHSTVFTWPLHERPWDFWRFSDSGLRMLFNPALGFEVEYAGMRERCRIHCEEPKGLMGYNPAFYTWMESVILARKVRDIPADRARWNIAMDEALPKGDVYPELNTIGRERQDP